MPELPPDLLQERDKWRNFPRTRPAHIVTPGPGQESVWDYPRPPRVEPFTLPIRVEFAEIVLAETDTSYRVLETSGPPVYYLPPHSVATHYLIPSSNTALCEWKGISRYWSIQVGERLSPNAAWSYPEPWEGYEQIRDHIAFNASRVDACYVGGERVRPQPGEYYGGWITSTVVGPFKGEPGSEQW